MGWIIAIIVGGVAGWLASIVMRRDASMGIVMNIIVGIVGALLGNFLAGALFGIEGTIQTFNLTGFIIAIIGIVGLATFNVMRKTKEISIRRVMGATASQSIAILASEFTWIVVAAVAVALPLVWYTATQWLSSFSYHIDTPWWAYFSAPAAIVLLTGAIIWVLGMKTVSANPTEVLRTE